MGARRQPAEVRVLSHEAAGRIVSMLRSGFYIEAVSVEYVT